jgi:hypothetical protein
MVYGLYRALPGEISSLASVAPRIAGLSDPVEPNEPPRDLTPAFEASGPHDFTVRVSIVRLACQVIAHGEQSALRFPCTRDTGRVHRISPRVRDVASRPCRWDETAGDMQLIWVGRRAVFF